jgi:monovalent cation/hydrogen antiporter
VTKIACTHAPAAFVAPRASACEDCESTESLRLCVSCGYVGCCESQAGHDRTHALATGHPVIRSLPLTGRFFTWCYTCNDYI